MIVLFFIIFYMFLDDISSYIFYLYLNAITQYFCCIAIWWQFDDVGLHGTKIVIYNLWKNDDGHLELDFDSDPEVEK